MVDFVNAAPMVNDQGTKDLSTRPLVLQPLAIPQHLPKLYIWAEKGKVGPSYINMNEYSLTQLYGDDTFDIAKDYHNHSTIFLKKIAAEGNNCVVHRLLPDDANCAANVALWLDVLEVDALPIYEKNADGSYKMTTGATPAKVQLLDPVTGVGLYTAPGYQVKWVAESVDAVFNPIYGSTGYAIGGLASKPGDQTSGGSTSTRYPIFEFVAANPGTAGNKIGFSLFPQLQSDLSPLSMDVFNETKNYPYSFMLKRVVNELTGKIAPVTNNYAATSVNFVVEPGKRDAGTGAVIYAGKIVNDAYISYAGDNNANELGSIHVYNSNLETLLGQFCEAELNVANALKTGPESDVDANVDPLLLATEPNIYAFNVIGFTNSNGSPYNAVQFATGSSATGSIKLTPNTTVMLAEGNDGTIGNAAFDLAVAEDMVNYNDPAHEYMDLVLHPESHMYDTGFTMATKKALAKFISRRRDTYVVASPFAWDKASVADRSIQSQISVAQALQSVFGLYPESVIFGTPCMRASIIAGSCLLLNSTYTERLPVSIEVAIKSARYMGAAEGKWKNGFIFDSQPGSLLTEVSDVDMNWVPKTTRNALWSAGITFVANENTRQKFFTALKTVYNNDTSVLNSYFVATAICFLNKIEHAAWRRFTGNISLTSAQLITGVNEFVAAQVKDRFDGQFKIIPDCRITEFDKQRGYSYTLVIKIGANNMSTVATTSVEAYRMADLLA